MVGRDLGITVLALACMTLASCQAQRANQPAGRPLAGCYQFERDEGARALGLPWGVTLEMEELAGYPNLSGARRAVTMVDAERTASNPFNYWAVTDSGTVRIGVAPGGGISLDLLPSNGELHGFGRALGDAMPPAANDPARGPFPVTAHRVVCDEA